MALPASVVNLSGRARGMGMLRFALVIAAGLAFIVGLTVRASWFTAAHLFRGIGS